MVGTDLGWREQPTLVFLRRNLRVILPDLTLLFPTDKFCCIVDIAIPTRVISSSKGSRETNPWLGFLA